MTNIDEELPVFLPQDIWDIIKSACITVAESETKDIDDETKEVLRKTYFEIKNQCF